MSASTAINLENLSHCPLLSKVLKAKKDGIEYQHTAGRKLLRMASCQSGCLAYRDLVKRYTYKVCDHDVSRQRNIPVDKKDCGCHGMPCQPDGSYLIGECEKMVKDHDS